MKKLILLFAATMALELPSNFKKCKMDAIDCNHIAIRDAIISMANGISYFGTEPIEPLTIDKLVINNPPLPVFLRQEFRNIKVHGITKGLQISNYRLDWKKLKLTFQESMPSVEITSDYKLNSRIFVIFLEIEGHCRIMLHNVSITNEIQFERFQKNGETYMRIKTYKLNTYSQKITPQFDNIIDPNSALGKVFTKDELNKFLQENFQAVYEDIKPLIREAIAQICLEIGNKIYTRIPWKNIYLDS